MTRAHHPLELLAPAKNLAQGREAILHGADAVYIGGPGFGARAAAGNSLGDIAELCQFAHRFHAHVYVAFNTLLTDAELEPARRLAHALYEAGADALIVQDMGLLQLDLPPIALHASTQTDNRDLAKVRLLEQLGFSQVVLARELSLAQIQTIAQGSQVTLEAFIHGALCVSYSGQCYISHAMTGRSANRGECAQICRLPCTLTGKDGRVLAADQHLLSLKDLNQSAHLLDLVDAGVRSLKIEGRLKGPEYVKNVTAWYRQQLDALLAQRPELAPASAGRCSYSFMPNPAKSFHRGHTDYFLLGRSPEISNFATPKYAGEPAGKVSRLSPPGKGPLWFEVAAPAGVEFHNGDGLTYFRGKELMGVRVNRAEGQRLFPAESVAGLKVGMALYRNQDQAFNALLAKPSAQRRIGVTLTLGQAGDDLCLDLLDESGCRAQVRLPGPHPAAKDADQASAQLTEQLQKLGNTDFYAEAVALDLPTLPFVPSGRLNALRREGCEALMAARLADYQRPRALPVTLPLPMLGGQRLSYLANIYNAAAAAFYQQLGAGKTAPAFEAGEETREVPLMITRHCLRYSFGQCPKEREAGFKPDPLTLTIGQDQFRLRFDCVRCEMQVLGRLKPAKR